MVSLYQLLLSLVPTSPEMRAWRQRGIRFCQATPKESSYIGATVSPSQVREAAEGDERDLIREHDMSEGSGLDVRTLAAGSLEQVAPVIRVRHERKRGRSPSAAAN